MQGGNGWDHQGRGTKGGFWESQDVRGGQGAGEARLEAEEGQKSGLPQQREQESVSRRELNPPGHMLPKSQWCSELTQGGSRVTVHLPPTKLSPQQLENRQHNGDVSVSTALPWARGKKPDLGNGLAPLALGEPATTMGS